MTYPTFEGGAPALQQQPAYQPAPLPPLPVVGFVLALLLPIVGVFVCHSERKQAQAEGRDNQLARAGFYISLVALIASAAIVVLYIAIFAAMFSAVSSAGNFG